MIKLLSVTHLMVVLVGLTWQHPQSSITTTLAFSFPSVTTRRQVTSLQLSSSTALDDKTLEDEDVQWEQLIKHHAKGSWRGVWTTFDYIGDVQDETVASVNLDLSADDNEQVVEHTHTVVVGAKRSDCPTCFDSMETKTFQMGEYRKDRMLASKRTRLAGVAMVNGPSLLRSGAMSTELILKHGDGRVRVILQHAPVWETGVEPNSCPPQGLKLFRVIMSREALRSAPPTKETEEANPPTDGNPIFFRPVPPFNWHKKWSGTSWTWGPQRGNQGWSVDELDETDSWQGITPVDCWNLRQGSIHIQTPKVITDATVGICRLAWLPTDETLLRVEAGVSALQPMVVDDDTMVGFERPSLTSLRCDMFEKLGELDDPTRPFASSSQSQDDMSVETKEEKVEAPATPIPTATTTANPKTPSPAASSDTSSSSDPRDALSL